jgi:hypothetical protein
MDDLRTLASYLFVELSRRRLTIAAWGRWRRWVIDVVKVQRNSHRGVGSCSCDWRWSTWPGGRDCSRTCFLQSRPVSLRLLHLYLSHRRSPLLQRYVGPCPVDWLLMAASSASISAFGSVRKSAGNSWAMNCAENLECGNLLPLWYSATCRRSPAQPRPAHWYGPGNRADGGDRSPNTKALTGQSTPNSCLRFR